MRVVVAEDVMLTREGIARLLTDADVEVAAAVGDAAALLHAVRTTQPDAAIVDIRMPPTHTDEGLAAAQQIRTEHPGVSVLILSQYVEPHYAMRLLEDHPERVGYLLKERVFDVASLIDALRRLADGETVVDPTIVARLFARKRHADPLDELSRREREVLALVAEGLSNRAIAACLFVTERTVEAHVKQIFLKLGLDADPGSHRRVLAVLAYLRSTPLPTALLPGQAGTAQARQVSFPGPRQRSGTERGRIPRSARARPGSRCRLPLWSG